MNVNSCSHVAELFEDFDGTNCVDPDNVEGGQEAIDDVIKSIKVNFKVINKYFDPEEYQQSGEL